VYADIAPPNADNIGLHERLAFRNALTFSQVGFILGSWYDVG
jgi:L-amino acid N-acyltransferase YncA